MAPIEQLISAGAPMRATMQREQYYSEFAHKVNQVWETCFSGNYFIKTLCSKHNLVWECLNAYEHVLKRGKHWEDMFFRKERNRNKLSFPDRKNNVFPNKHFPDRNKQS